MGFNSGFKGLNSISVTRLRGCSVLFTVLILGTR